jgi:hypothetical protein
MPVLQGQPIRKSSYENRIVFELAIPAAKPSHPIVPFIGSTKPLSIAYWGCIEVIYKKPAIRADKLLPLKAHGIAAKGKCARAGVGKIGFWRQGGIGGEYSKEKDGHQG